MGWFYVPAVLILKGRAFIHNIRIREVRCTFADKNLEMFRTCFLKEMHYDREEI